MAIKSLVYFIAAGLCEIGGGVWLRLTGREGVKPFIMAELGDHLHSS